MPGVKELFQAASKPQREPAGPSLPELRRNVDASYYGYNLDEEDGTLLKYEMEREKQAWEALMKAAEKNEVNGGREDDWEELPGDAGDGNGWKLPTLDEVQEELVERRRKMLLDKLG